MLVPKVLFGNSGFFEPVELTSLRVGSGGGVLGTRTEEVLGSGGRVLGTRTEGVLGTRTGGVISVPESPVELEGGGGGGEEKEEDEEDEEDARDLARQDQSFRRLRPLEPGLLLLLRPVYGQRQGPLVEVEKEGPSLADVGVRQDQVFRRHCLLEPALLLRPVYDQRQGPLVDVDQQGQSLA